jgi:DNA-binding CsgD family transcriptional regulator
VWQAVLSDAAASVSLRRGDLVSARRLARAALDLMPAASWGVVVGSPLAHLLTALTRLGRFDEAEEVVRSGLSPAALRTTFGLRFLQARGELHLVTGRLRAALGDFLAVGELALAFTDLSRTYQELGRDDQAKLATRRARQLSDACEMPEPVAESPAAASVLSAAERRVANLAALGHTNREISRMLHVTISTVEQHLTRTYRKLNIHRRTDLPLVT